MGRQFLAVDFKEDGSVTGECTKKMSPGKYE